MFHKQNARQPLAAALLALLLALTSAFSCIGLSGWASFRRQLAALDAQYTTVAYAMNNESPARYDYLPVEEYEDGSELFEDGFVWASSERANTLAEKAPGFLRRDTNVLAAAYTPNQKGFSSGAADPLAYQWAYDWNRYAQTVAALRCVDIVKNPYYTLMNWTYYQYIFEWIDPVCRMDAYDLPEHPKVLTVEIRNDLQSDEEGNPCPPVEIGKTYLFRGNFKDFETHYWYKMVWATEDEPEHAEYYWYRYTQDNVTSMTGVDPAEHPAWHLYDFPWQEFEVWPPVKGEDGSPLDTDSLGHTYPLTPNFYLDSTPIPEEKDELGFFRVAYVPEGSWPLFTEYEGDWRDFLNTEEGRVWRDEIIPNCELNHNSVPVLLTDNIQGLSQFCQEESTLLEGRFITQEEYDRGDAVCMVGADYALYNGLQVGDTLTLDLYDTDHATQRGGLQLLANWATFYYTTCLPLTEANRLDVTRDYTIVGLYTAPVRPMDPDGHGFRGDTVLAPKASAPEVVNAAEEDKVTPLLNTLVLKNGSIEEFEAYMAENGAASRFRYYDYGYSEMKESVEAMKSSALRLALLGGAAFLIGGLVFLLASFARMSASARGLRLLGAGPRKVAGEMLSALLPLMAAGVIAGGVLGGLLYGRVCEAVLSQTLAPDWPGVAVCAALQLLALGAVAAVWAALTARRGLMRRKQE